MTKLSAGLLNEQAMLRSANDQFTSLSSVNGAYANIVGK